MQTDGNLVIYNNGTATFATSWVGNFVRLNGTFSNSNNVTTLNIGRTYASSFVVGFKINGTQYGSSEVTPHIKSITTSTTAITVTRDAATSYENAAFSVLLICFN